MQYTYDDTQAYSYFERLISLKNNYNITTDQVLSLSYDLRRALVALSNIGITKNISDLFSNHWIRDVLLHVPLGNSSIAVPLISDEKMSTMVSIAMNSSNMNVKNILNEFLSYYSDSILRYVRKNFGNLYLIQQNKYEYMNFENTIEKCSNIMNNKSRMTNDYDKFFKKYISIVKNDDYRLSFPLLIELFGDSIKEYYTLSDESSELLKPLSNGLTYYNISYYDFNLAYFMQRYVETTQNVKNPTISKCCRLSGRYVFAVFLYAYNRLYEPTDFMKDYMKDFCVNFGKWVENNVVWLHDIYNS